MLKQHDRDVELIVWFDACYVEGGMDLDERLNLSTVYTVGFVLDEDDVLITMSREISSNGVRAAISIPKVNLISRKKVCVQSISESSLDVIRRAMETR